MRITFDSTCNTGEKEVQLGKERLQKMVVSHFLDWKLGNDKVNTIYDVKYLINKGN